MRASSLKHALPAALLAALLCLAGAQAAQAEFGLAGSGASLTDGNGQFSRQAGAHADLTTHFELNRNSSGEVDGGLRDATVDLPPGLIANATIAPTCDFTHLILGGSAISDCPVASAVGWVEIKSASNPLRKPIYNMVRPDDAPTLFAFNFGGAAVKVEPRIRSSDFGASTDIVAVSQLLPPVEIDATFWAVPADPSHDLQRGDNGETAAIPSPERPRPFLTNPTSCPGAPLTFTVSIDSWQNPGAFLSESFDRDDDGTPFLFRGCDRVPFRPSVEVKPLSRAAAAPLGLELDLDVPQTTSPDGLASAHVRKTVVTFPEGISISPSSAAGQGACSEAEVGVGTSVAPNCPDSSRIGAVRIKTPILDEELEGGIYLAKQGENPFGSLLAMYLAVKGPGFYIKLPGQIDADPRTGQLTITFDNQPQLPYEEISLSLRSGPGAPLAAPATCGSYTTKVEVTSWASPVPVTLESPLTIDQNCGGGFDPGFKAGTSKPVASAFSPFLLQVTRQDGEQNLGRIEAALPDGLLAKLAGVPVCGDPQAASGTCAAASKVGSAAIAAGPGPTPLYMPEAGRAPAGVYLAGPYRGAPYSLVIRVPAQAGPFDFGTVLVRAGIYVDPRTAQVTIRSDPLPQILQGIPIAYRDLRVAIDRPDFTVNPSNCLPKKVAGSIVSAEGKTASPSAHFQVAGCERLGFKPKLALSLLGPTHRSAHPKLRLTVTTRKGDANISRAAVTLPKTEYLENAHIQMICSRVQFAAHRCPAKSVYGYAKAWSPLLDEPLAGPVYLRSSSRELPDLVASLDGAIHLDVSGRIDSVRARIRNTFAFLPDAPLSKFVFVMQGGEKGLLVNNTELCKAKPRADVKLDAQNGKFSDSTPAAAADCGRWRPKKQR
jgi:hypothetical protein